MYFFPSPSFHSCVSEGCNGCFEASSSENAGLKIVVKRLNKISQALGLNKIAYRTDLYALLATVTAEVGIDAAADIQFPKTNTDRSLNKP